MDIKLEQCLHNEAANYLLPFFWVHGEDEKKLRSEIKKIQEVGINAFCVESRPHPDFVGEKWWADMDVMIDEARQRNMKVWILDDVRFPTGFAAYTVEKAPPELKKWYLFRKSIDVYGPEKHTSFLINASLKEKEYLVGVVASKRTDEESEAVDASLINLTDRIIDGVLYWDIPEGHWRIFVLYETYEAKGANNLHVNHLNPASVLLLIYNVYQKHYDRYAQEFGKTIAGFFSDEPAFYNFQGTYEASIGRKPMLLPWRRGLLGDLQKNFSGDVLRYLPGLWYDIGEMTGSIRYTYMDLISKLYAENFTDQIGNWCREHRVEYIGHIIEDNNAHARVGNGPGHFFRSLWGQDMSGLDVVLLQILPGVYGRNMNLTGLGDGEFFHFGLAKMAASLGHMDPKKKGRTMCEIYGAYGWMEGLKLMKWLTDHMLVRGVNYFVPHAFTNREFPDRDCPPHFNYDQVNPQFRYLHLLMEYTNRICHLLSDGTHIPCGLILYHAEAEWSGDYMLFQKPLRKLMESQTDCDILPSDLFENMAFEEKQIKINREKYKFVVVPYSEGLPGQTLGGLLLAAEKGVKVFFIDAFPRFVSDDIHNAVLPERLRQNPNCSTVDLEGLPEAVACCGFADIKCMTAEPYLRVYHYQRENREMYMFFNEHPTRSISNEIELKNISADYVYLYNAFENDLSFYGTFSAGQPKRLRLELSAYESKLFILDPTRYGDIKTAVMEAERPDSTELLCDYEVSTSEAADYTHFTYRFALRELRNISAPDLLPKFSGTIRYETRVTFDQGLKNVVLDLGDCYEVAEVWVNGVHCGVRLCAPYRFDIGTAVVEGENLLTMDVTNTLVKAHNDYYSSMTKQEPSGLLGPVILRY